MELHSQPKTTTRTKKRLGRGYGSGKGGHTAGRGQKGQKSRSSIPIWFTGTSWVWFKRLPMLRGKDKFKPVGKETLVISSDQLNTFRAGETVDLKSLVKKGLITERESKRYEIKVLLAGKLEKKIKLDLPASKELIKQIKKLGGEYLSENT